MVMPVIDMEVLKSKLTAKDYEIACLCVKKSGNVYRLRATKPSDGLAIYVWRMAAFSISPHRQHHCMPVTCDFGIKEHHYAHRPEVYEPTFNSESERKAVESWDQKTWDMMHRGVKERAFIKNELDPITEAIVNTVPKNEWHGVISWGRALGAL